MRIVTANELQNWLSQAEVLEKDSRGPKVVKLPNGELLKIFRSRRHHLLGRLLPAAKRFAKHAERLQALDIRTPTLLEYFWIDPGQAVSACRYQPLEGIPLDKLFLSSRADFERLLPELAGYIRQLHLRGIYFRSLHLGNILRTPDQGFGLIDFLDIRFKNHPLGRLLIRRNFQHLQNYLQRRKLHNFPWDRLIRCYEEASSTSN